MKRDSIGWYTDLVKVPVNIMKRARMRAEKRRNRSRSKAKIIFPIVINPGNVSIIMIS